ncbi:MAG TPA: hypothetical protein VJV23_07585 [Candidatus Polarisedimenticolia bacterium]|nr:hypothetical protein [Candidatus Polarisedimenticolia bacterium]
MARIMNQRLRPDGPPGASLYAGLFLVALSTLMYETLLTRLFSVTMHYHFAFVAISVAMLGLAAGAIVVHAWPSVFSGARAAGAITVGSVLFAATGAIALAGHLKIKAFQGAADGRLSSLAPVCALVAVPFLCGGVSVCLALTRSPLHAGRLYAADLAGAGLGCVGFIVLLERLDAPSAILASCAGGAWAAVLFARTLPRRHAARRAAWTAAAALSVLAAGHAASAAAGAPWLGLSQVKGRPERDVLFERWNAFSRITVEGDPDALWHPSGWGLSPRCQAPPVRELNLWIDSAAGTTLTGYRGGAVEHLACDVVNIAHRLRTGTDVLVIGSGGGRDVLAALSAGQRSVTAVEINETILSAVNGTFGDFTGHLDRDPRVRFVNDEARSWLARQETRYGIIQISFIDTWAASLAGGFALMENSLYTSEAWELLLDRLGAGGILTVSRWYLAERPSEVYRLASLAAAALEARGVEDPRAHVMVVRSFGNTAGDGFPDGIGTVLVGADPFDGSDALRLRGEARALGFDVVLAPDGGPSDALLASLLDSRRRHEAAASYPLDISAPTDDRPFFFHMMRLGDVFDRELRRVWVAGANTIQLRAVAVLGGLLLAVLVLVFGLVVVAPSMRRGGVAALRRSAPLFVYFGAIGLGFMLVEISQMQRFSIVLGHPSYALSVVLFSLLVASGCGSLAAGRLGWEGRRRGLALLGLLVAALAVFGAASSVLLPALERAATPIRLAAAGALLAIPGFFLGIPFGLGMRLAGRREASRALTAWLWGVNGGLSVVGSVLAVAIALTAGISAAFWAGAASYAAALAAFAWGARKLD